MVAYLVPSLLMVPATLSVRSLRFISLRSITVPTLSFICTARLSFMLCSLLPELLALKTSCLLLAPVSQSSVSLALAAKRALRLASKLISISGRLSDSLPFTLALLVNNIRLVSLSTGSPSVIALAVLPVIWSIVRSLGILNPPYRGWRASISKYQLKRAQGLLYNKNSRASITVSRPL